MGGGRSSEAFEALWSTAREEDSLAGRLAMESMRRRINRVDPEAPPTSLGRFRIVRRLGRGGQGSVYEGVDPKLQRRVALKLPRFRDDQRWRASFEARALARVRHRSLVTVYDFEAHQGRGVLVMELVEGTPLLQWAASDRPTVQRLVSVACELGDGLTELHRVGLAHRDVKPDNVLVDDRGRPRLVDLGLAATAGSWSRGGGTPRFAAPEQFEEGPTDPAADQYGLAATICAALAAAQRRPSRALSRILGRARHREPQQRYPDVAAFTRALRSDRRRRRLARSTLTLGLGALVVAPALPSEQECGRNPDAWSAQAWSSQRRDELRDHFEAIDDPVGVESFDVVARSLDGYVQRWTDAAAAVCATPSGSRWEGARAACLDESAARFDAVLEEMTTLDRGTASAAPLFTAMLGRPEACIDSELRWLPDPEQTRRWMQTRQQFATTRARCVYGLTSDCDAEYDAIVQTSRAAGVDDCAWEPAIAIERATSGHRSGGSEDTRQGLQEAILAAERCGNDPLKLQAQLFLSEQIGRSGDFEAAEAQLAQAEATLQRLGRPPSQQVAVLASRAMLMLAANRFDEAGQAAQDAVDTHAQLRGAPEQERAQLLEILAGVYAAKGEMQAAIDLEREALELRRRELGGHHPMVGLSLANLSLSLLNRDRAQARVYSEQAVEILERHRDGFGLQLAIVTMQRAILEFHDGELDRARRSNDSAMPVLIAHTSPDSDRVGEGLLLRSRIELAEDSTDAALRDGLRAHEILVARRGPFDDTTIDALGHLASVYAAQRPDEYKP